MRFLLSALGSAGDVHPFIALGRGLSAHGHTVRLLAAPPFEARVRAAGIDFRPVGAPGEYERVLQDPAIWDARRGSALLIEHLLGHLREALACTAAAIDGDDTVLVGSTLSWAVRLLQEQRGLRAATLHLSPLCLMSATDPAVLPGIGDLSWLPPWALRWLQRSAERWGIDPEVAPRLNAFRAGLGLPPVRRVLSRWLHSPQLVLCAWPDWFAPAQADWPPHAMTTGFPRWSEPGTTDPSLEAFLAGGAPPIGITPGSAMAHGADFVRQALAACDRHGRRALVITPYRHQVPARLPAWAMQVDYAPFSTLLPRLSALVHHGGIGTCAQAIAAGTAQLVRPFAHDQFDNAARLRRLGLAVTVGSQAADRDVDRALARLLDHRSLRATAARYAQRSQAETPAVASMVARLEAWGR